jgi:hypothetical protein
MPPPGNFEQMPSFAVNIAEKTAEKAGLDMLCPL